MDPTFRVVYLSLCVFAILSYVNSRPTSSFIKLISYDEGRARLWRAALHRLPHSRILPRLVAKIIVNPKM